MQSVRKELEHPIYNFELFEYINQLYLLQTRYLILLVLMRNENALLQFVKVLKEENLNCFITNSIKWYYH